MYSWAVSVLEMFAGERCWEHGVAAPANLDILLQRGPVNPRVPRMPREMADVLWGCLAQKPTDRPSSFAAVVDALEVLLEPTAG